MYSDRESFDDFHRERGEACDYEAMRDDLRALGHDWIVHESALDATPLHEHGAHGHDHDSGHHHP